MVYLDGLMGLGIGALTLAIVRLFSDHLSFEAKELPWIGHGIFVVAPVCAGVVRLFGGDLLITFRVGAFSVLFVAAGLVVSAVRHRRRRAEFLLTAGILALCGLLVGIPLLGTDEVVVINGW